MTEIEIYGNMHNLWVRSLRRLPGVSPWCRILKIYILLSRRFSNTRNLSTISLCLVLWWDIIISITGIISIWWLFWWTLTHTYRGNCRVTISVFTISFGFCLHMFLFRVWMQFIWCQWWCLAIWGRIFPFQLRWFWNRIGRCIYKTSYIGWKPHGHP